MIVKVEKIINGGYGLARTERGICMVPFSVPGDVLDVECSTNTNPIFCWIKKIVKPSDHRIVQECPNFGMCGGCDFQEMNYEYELKVKKKIVKEDIKRIAGIDIDKIDSLYSQSFYYRNNVQFKTNGKSRIGFFRKKSNDVVPLPPGGCMLIDKNINSFIQKIKNKVDLKRGSFRVRANKEGFIFKKGITGIEDDLYCNYKAFNMIFRIGIDDFFQVNNHLYEDWLNLIIDYIKPDNRDIIADLFAGSGLITLNLAKGAYKVFGMELNGASVKNAKYNSVVNSIDNVIFRRVDVNKVFYLEERPNKIVVDPPRSGLSRLLINRIAEYSPEVIVYASCNTATFSRDIGILYKKGFVAKQIIIVDLFPRTAHMEVIAKLVQK